MSFAYREYPDVSGQCWICGRHDCSGPDEKWLHILAQRCENEYNPAIGRKCVELMFANSGLSKPDAVTTEVVRTPTEAEILAHIREHFTLSEVKTDDYRPDPVHDAKPGTPVDDGSKHDQAPKRTRRTNRQNTGRQSRGVRGQQT